MRPLAVGLLAATLAATLAPAEAAERTSCATGDGDWIARACFAMPLDPPRYGHGVLGNTPEWSRLAVTPGPRGRDLPRLRDRLPPDGILRLDTLSDRIIEDVAPRIVEVTGGAPPEVLFVESDRHHGARIAALDLTRMEVVAGPFIGQRHRWLAPVGAADLDGDGRIEVAWVDRPHLRRDLVVGRVEDGAIVEAARMNGLTNHRIGDEIIVGGLRDCGRGPELVLTSADWTRVMVAAFDGATLSARDAGPLAPGALDAALACAR